ncbi:MFS transporter [Zooshikella marina]|uniref:MFS transporter n=1 Tax=Zooshikella ganghwensis TaxID=202772 RepID=UPI001BB067A5|nr:MFS transporter [Zooshikella ganghwensis]MBU2704970.1 MFS transporter [Zooshikella ganghwensis]
MQRKLTLTLSISLLMFPQVVETIYSPALTHIASGFNITAQSAAQTLSFYFIAFAFGVVVWGRLCDVIGRRPTILAGLILYTLASVIALYSTSFIILMIARILAAFGAAVGSVGIQTAMRDHFDGSELARVFSIVGVAIAISPAIGVLSGTLLAHWWGYQGVFFGLALLAATLLGYVYCQLPETMPKQVKGVPFFSTLHSLVRDADIWRSAFLIALYNICVFGYYQLAPFRFEALGIPKWFGYTGLVLAAGIGVGAVTNKHLIAREWQFKSLLTLASLLSMTGSILVYMFEQSFWFVLPMLLVVMAYGIAIPNVLARALQSYKNCIGTAGAILGLMYYLILGGGLVIAGMVHNLGLVLLVVSLLIIIISGSVNWLRVFSLFKRSVSPL